MAYLEYLAMAFEGGLHRFKFRILDCLGFWSREFGSVYNLCCRSIFQNLVLVEQCCVLQGVFVVFCCVLKSFINIFIIDYKLMNCS